MWTHADKLTSMSSSSSLAESLNSNDVGSPCFSEKLHVFYLQQPSLLSGCSLSRWLGAIFGLSKLWGTVSASWACRNKVPRTEGLRATESLVSQFWRPAVWNQGVSRAVLSLKIPGENPSSPLPASSSCWRPVLAGPWLGGVSRPIWPPSSRGLLPVSGFLCPNVPLPIGTTVILDLGSIFIQDDLIITWWPLQRPCFQIRSH